jgi:uncharacterized protein YjbI with pentapeptide repeats
MPGLLGGSLNDAGSGTMLGMKLLTALGFSAALVLSAQPAVGHIGQSLRTPDLESHIGQAAVPTSSFATLKSQKSCLAELESSRKAKRPARLQKCDLTRMNLSGRDLRKANLSYARLCGTNLADADLSGANLSYANTTSDQYSFGAGKYDPECDASGNTTSGRYESCAQDIAYNNTQFPKAYFAGANLSGANLTNAYLAHADFRNTTMKNMKLRVTNFSCANLQGADLSRSRGTANFFKAQLSNSVLVSVRFNYIDLSIGITTSFVSADLTDADFSNAKLQGNGLNGSNLTRTNFTGADLQKADLSGSNIVVINGQVLGESTNFTNANLADSNFAESRFAKAIFKDANLSRANFFEVYLGNADFSGAITIDTIYSGSYMPDGSVHPCDKKWRYLGNTYDLNCGAAFAD